MPKLNTPCVNEQKFSVISFRSSNAGVSIKFPEGEAKTFTLNKDGGLPDELFEIISEQSGIPKYKLAIHIFEV